MRLLTMTDEQHNELRRLLVKGLGHEEDQGYRGRRWKDMLATVNTAAPLFECGETGCAAVVPDHKIYCSKHEDIYERVEAMQAGS